MTSAAYGSLPFQAQIDFLKQKVSIPTAAWTDVYAGEHDHGLMVAGARGQVLEDVHSAIARFINQGNTLADFRKDFDGIVARTGWAYNGGRNWRTRIIYETNLRQSYNAGREAQMADPALRKGCPYGLYRHGSSAEPREEHLAWDGTVLPLDDPWWNTHSPQNGWGCSCKKFTLSKRDVQRMGLAVAEQAPPVQWEEQTVGIRGPSPRTVRVPKGIDPGFEYRPGV
ncbi:phage head morphogenesis protein [Candidatus Vondammii sp. HM_W22]|uniref:phage head morphogenesis protein n=1 Tax=Candidatus Vondammii sp. HM_W22 TaxID=2687299 RepID=UPI001F143882|nr:phage minor head protein [Candidatus Vondammii sp. HM_W22]